MVTPKPYEKRLLNGEPIVVVFKKEGKTLGMMKINFGLKK